MTEATPSRTRTRSATKAESMDEQKTDGKLGAGEQKPDDKPAGGDGDGADAVQSL